MQPITDFTLLSGMEDLDVVAGIDELERYSYLYDMNTYTIQLGLRTFVDSTSASDWGGLFAMSTLTLVPVFFFFLFFQRLLIEGIATTGMKR